VGEGGSAENTWKCLDRFPFAQVEFNIRALSVFPFSAYWEQNFKDAFKSSFKSATCLHEHENCPVCKSKKNCPYLYVFETPFPSDSAKKPEFLSPPQPFIISPPLDRTRNYDPGKNFTFEITLIGKALEPLAGFISSFGYGHNRGITWSEK